MSDAAMRARMDGKQATAVSDAAMRARMDGKQATAARIVWLVELHHLRLRCLKPKIDGGTYEVQFHTGKGWQPLAESTLTPLQSFEKLSKIDLVRAAIERVSR